jgi:hypothetical protein
MIAWRVKFAVAVVACSTALPAATPTGTGSSRPSDTGSAEVVREAEASRAMDQFARCLARQNRWRAEAALALPYLSKEQSLAAANLVKGSGACLGRGAVAFSFTPRALMGGLAERFILDRFKQSDLERVARFSETEVAAAGLVPRNAAEEFGLCVALRESKNIHALISTPPASDEEGSIIAQITPQLGPCLFEGETVSINREAVRSILSVGLYRALSVLAAAKD